jgi:hypothetical protein
MNCRYPAFSMLFVAAASASAADNPMWSKGLAWSCEYSAVIRCERGVDCVSSREEGTIFLDYRENRLTGHMGAPHLVKRHYTQTVTGSPLGSEVKIEFETNEVIWLVPADGAGVFSDNWTGAMVSPKTGVIVQELRPLMCKPQGR